MRKVGEEFWSEWMPPPLNSTDTEETRIKYRVVEIVNVHQYGTHGPLVDAERLEPLAVEKREQE